jgi:hypothetical protein
MAFVSIFRVSLNSGEFTLCLMFSSACSTGIPPDICTAVLLSSSSSGPNSPLALAKKAIFMLEPDFRFVLTSLKASGSILSTSILLLSLATEKASVGTVKYVGMAEKISTPIFTFNGNGVKNSIVLTTATPAKPKLIVSFS